MSIFKNRGCFFTIATLFFVWYATFQWPIVNYPRYGDGPCYSPNHAFYVTRHQTLWEAANISTPHDFGTARLYDRAGKLLYEEKTWIDEQVGPRWLDGNARDPTNRPAVFYQGTNSKGWIFYLPESPGTGAVNSNCYNKKIDQITQP